MGGVDISSIRYVDDTLFNADPEGLQRLVDILNKAYTMRTQCINILTFLSLWPMNAIFYFLKKIDIFKLASNVSKLTYYSLQSKQIPH